MDSGNTPNSGAYDRSDEEVSWDAEFADMDQTPASSSISSTLGDLVRLAVQVPAALIQMPMSLLPGDTAKHARAAAREGFLAVRSLLGAIGDGIENALTEPAERKGTVAGPEGTWGNARYSGTTPTPPGKARRIEVSDEVSERSGGEGQRRITIDDLGDTGDVDETEGQGRGLRADIDY
ncbi:MAG: hypothetical protein ABI670_13445 [Chloroflexota bacterium]